MAVTASPRLGLTRWSAGSDPFRRTQLDADHAAIDANVALYKSGLFNDRPAAGVAGRFYWATDVNGGTLYYDSGSAWSAGVVLTTDTRLTDARTPTAHVHAAGDVTSGVFGTARLGTGTASSSTYLRGDGTWAAIGGGSLATLTDTAISGLASGQFLRYNGTAWANAAIAIGDLPVASSGSSSSTQVVRADDSRLNDSRTPTAHSHGIADLPVAASGTSSSTQVVRADDSRLSNNRTPTAHAASHASAGSDPITPAAIGAAPTASPTFTGTATAAALTVTGRHEVGDANTDVEQVKSLRIEADTRNLVLTYGADGIATVAERDGTTALRTYTLGYSGGLVATVSEAVDGKTITTTIGYTDGRPTTVTRSVA